LRAINERTVLDLILRGGATSRAQIARESGLSKPTVSLALGSLVDAGLVHEVGRATGGKGPSAVLYELNPQAGWVVGIDVGAHWLRSAVADITGRIVARLDERASSRSSGALVRQIGDVAHRVAQEAGLRWRQVTHATVGSSGVLDPSRGLLAHAPNLPGWGRQGLVGAIREQLGTAVSFENDVNLAALGERWHGAGQGVENFAFLWIGTGVGMGVIIDGELYRGAGGAAGEIGYMPLGTGDPSDPRFRRRGMLEEWASASAVTGAARASGLRQAAKGIFAAARRGDPAAAAIVEEEAGRIAVAIAAVAPVLDPELVVLGGGIGSNPDLLPAVERRLSTISPFGARLATSQLGEQAVLHGAVVTALESARDQLFTRKPLSRTAVV
jgi:predicted NBD/HSP70 family sugar kinase